MNFLYGDERPVIALIVVIIALLLAATFWVDSKIQDRRNHLIEKCMEDGRKEYECEAMFKREASQSVPIIVPMYTGR